MTAEINVSIERCPLCGPEIHPKGCTGTPVNIPCPIPRTVEFTVRLGECSCAAGIPRGRAEGLDHLRRCPARPICVTCSNSGETWAESEVVEARPAQTQWQPPFSSENERLLVACRERWALVKGILLNTFPSYVQGNLIAQRDTVFAALADMARAEEIIYRRDAEIRAMLGCEPGSQMPAKNRPSAFALERYVEHLITQIGAMS